MGDRTGRTAGKARQTAVARTRDAVVERVARGDDSVERIATALALTPNAVRFHLAALEHDGIVERTGVERGGSVGKPHDVYALTDAAREQRSRAYAPVLAAIVHEVTQRMDPAELAPLLTSAGASLAVSPDRPMRASERLTERVRSAAALLEELGAVIDVVRTRDAVVLQGHGCPLASVVARQPAACLVVAGLLGAATGASVREECDHGERPSCRFRIARSEPPRST